MFAATGLLTPITVGQGPSGIAVGADGVWVADTLDDAVVRIDPSTRAVTTTIPVGHAPAGIAVGAGSVWVANSGDGTLSRIDPEGGKKPETIEVGAVPARVRSTRPIGRTPARGLGAATLGSLGNGPR